MGCSRPVRRGWSKTSVIDRRRPALLDSVQVVCRVRSHWQHSQGEHTMQEAEPERRTYRGCLASHLPVSAVGLSDRLR